MKKKQIFITLTAMALTAVLAVGGTLAYLSTITETKKNVFTSSDLGGYIEEEFDGELAKKYTPGDAIYKQPRIGLEAGSGSDAYVAARVVCTYKDNATGESKTISLADFQEKFGTIRYKDSNGAFQNGVNPAWVSVSANGVAGDVFKYTDGNGVLKVLAKGEKTANIFDEVVVLVGIEEQVKTEYQSTIVYEETSPGVYEVVDKTDTSSQSKAIYIKNADGTYTLTDIYELPEFEIDVQGFLVQNTGMETEQDYVNALMELVSAN